MGIKIFSIALLAILAITVNSHVLAYTQYSNGLYTHFQSMFCAETSSDEKKDKETKEEEEEPDCD